MTLTLRREPEDCLRSVLARNAVQWRVVERGRGLPDAPFFPQDFSEICSESDRISLVQQRAHLAEAGLRVTSHSACETLEAALTWATETNELPIAAQTIAKHGLYERIASSPEDLSLAWNMVRKHTVIPGVVLESARRGTSFSVFLERHDDTIHCHGIVDHESAPPPFRYAVASTTRTANTMEGAHVEFARRALDALGIANGVARVDIAEVGETLEVSFVDTCGLALGLPVDLLAAAGNPSFANNAVAAVVSSKWNAPIPLQRSVSFRWLPVRSGQVMVPPDTGALLAMPGIVAAQVTAKTDDSLRHAIDAPGVRQVGYVVAAGNTTDEAESRARAAVEAHPVKTEKVLYG